MKKHVVLFLSAFIFALAALIAGCDSSVPLVDHNRSPGRGELKKPFYRPRSAKGMIAFYDNGTNVVVLQYRIDAAPEAFIQRVRSNIPGKWKPVDAPSLNRWTRTNLVNPIDGTGIENARRLVSAYSHPDGRAFTFEIAYPADASRFPTEIRVDMALYKPPAAQGILTHLKKPADRSYPPKLKVGGTAIWKPSGSRAAQPKKP